MLFANPQTLVNVHWVNNSILYNLCGKSPKLVLNFETCQISTDGNGSLKQYQIFAILRNRQQFSFLLSLFFYLVYIMVVTLTLRDTVLVEMHHASYTT